MAPASLLSCELGGRAGVALPDVEAARLSRAAWRHGHFAAKPASRGTAAGTPADDFAAGKDGSVN